MAYASISTRRQKMNRPRAKRTEPDLRRAEILEVAIDLAAKVGYSRILRSQVAHNSGLSENLISRYHSSMPKLRRTVLREGLARKIPAIIAQALAAREPTALSAPESVKQLGVDYILKR